jgi:hypothetical protein
MKTLLVLLPIVIALTWARLIRFGSNRIEGTILHIAPLPLLARIRMHAVPSLLAIALGLALAITGTMSWWFVLAPLVSAILLIAIPANYTLTDQGIRLGRSSFRRWTEFGGVRRARGGARLPPVSGVRGMHIWLSGSRGDDEFLQVIRTLIRNAYKGSNSVIAFPDSHQPATSAQASPGPTTHGISAFRSDPLA